ncbi:MAG: hypothetical protein ABIQ95_15390 [Bdellovibrionia bacterium]
MKHSEVHKMRYTDLSSSPDAQRAILLSTSDARKLNESISGFYGIKYQRLFFGYPIEQALKKGFQITHSGYFEATESPSASQTATTLSRLRREMHPRPIIQVLDLFAGTGQMAWAFQSKETSLPFMLQRIIYRSPVGQVHVQFALEIASPG